MTKLVEQQLKRHMHDIMNLCEQSRKTKVEHGFSICYGKMMDIKRTHIESRCKGEACSVEMKGCKEGPVFASCHSHPKGATVMPSTMDLILSIANGEQAFCICAPMKGKNFTQCYEMTTDENMRHRFIKAYNEHNLDIQIDMIAKSLWSGDDTTLFKPIINVVKKRKR